MSKKRLYISIDIEGVAGITSIDQLVPGKFEYPQARKWMTDEVNAACKAAFSSGIDEIVISDSHANGQNLLLDELVDNVEVVRSWPRPLCMMEGVQTGEYVAALLLGYHSAASDANGVLAHTLQSNNIREVRLNGQVVSEAMISSATAAHFGVPVVMVSGDDAFVEGSEVLPGNEGCPIERVVTKWSISRTCTRTLLPRKSCALIADGVTAALSRLDDFHAKPLPNEIRLEVDCGKRTAVEVLCYLPNVKRVGAYTIEFVGKDMVEVSTFLSFLIHSGSLNA